MRTERAQRILYFIATVILAQVCTIDCAMARFGGGGGMRGGFANDGFGGHSFSNGDHFANGDRFGNIDRSYYDTPTSTSSRPLATDGAWSRVAGTDYGHMAAPVRGPIGANGVNGDAVRRAYYDHPYYDRRAFDADWWAHHYSCGWYYPWMGGSYCWGFATWPMMAAFWGMSVANQPVAYDYGNNITYQNNTVYYGSQPYASAEQYAQQANSLATSAPAIVMTQDKGMPVPKLKPENEKDWKALGVFSLVQNGQTDSSKLFQIAVNKEGVIHGNYYDMMTDEVKPINGAIDKKSMRAAWKISGVNDITYDTGLANLMNAQSPILVHYGNERTQQWSLVRLEQTNIKQEAANRSS